MILKTPLRSSIAALSLAALLCAGCQSQSAPLSAPVSESTTATAGSESVSAEDDDSAITGKKRKFKPVKLGEAASSAAVESDPASAETVLSAMQPLQVLLGKWNGTPRKSTVDEPQWVWDFQSNRAQPALVFKSAKNVFVREGHLTFLPAEQQYQFAWTTPEGDKRLLKGTFTKPVQDVAGEDSKKLQRTYKLTLAEAEPKEGEQWQLAIEQIENNRYVLEIDRRRGKGPYQRIDTFNTLREGTSFAISDTDYGEQTCIISQGKGTSTVSYMGKSYYVCCSGCKAAFEEDPERWIAKWEARQKAMKKPE